MVVVMGRKKIKEELTTKSYPRHKGRMKVAAMGRRVIDKWGIDNRNER